MGRLVSERTAVVSSASCNNLVSCLSITIPSADLLKVYFALIRSVLEYCCPVWHNALPVKLSDSIERVQKRALHIILPALHYQEALATTGCVSLHTVANGSLAQEIHDNSLLVNHVPLISQFSRLTSPHYSLRKTRGNLILF